MNELTSNINQKKILAFIIYSLILGFLPPFSWEFLLVSLLTSAIIILTGIYGNYYRNKELILVYRLGHIILLAFFTGLRFIDMGKMLSWDLVGWLLPGMLPAAILPFFNKRLSDLLYRAQISSQNTKIGKKNFKILFVIGILGASVGQAMVRVANGDSLVIMGYILYIVTLDGIFLCFYMYAANQFSWLKREEQL